MGSELPRGVMGPTRGEHPRGRGVHLTRVPPTQRWWTRVTSRSPMHVGRVAMVMGVAMVMVGCWLHERFLHFRPVGCVCVG